MLFQCSDLHPEIRGSQWRHTFEKFFAQQESHLSEIDFVLAGDNGSFLDQSFKSVIDVLSQKVRHVYFILGNHEFQGCTFPMAIEQANHYETLFSNVTFLHRKSVKTVDGILLVGATLWSDVTRMSLNQMYNIEESIADFRQIHASAKVPWTINSMLEEYQKDLLFLKNAFKENSEETIVVVTHFAPLLQCNPKEHESSKNIFQFCNDLTQLIQTENPRVWIQGHVHGGNHAFMCGKTQVVRACIGYNFEKTQGSIAQLHL